jgi:predicted nucleotidyltransferase component of viral defense system
MNPDSPYFKQVQLLIRVLPLIAREKCFALKGGTAINLFVRNLPRLSVDIDLVYLPMDDRDTALENIRAALSRISESIGKAIQGARVQNTHEQSDALRLIVHYNDVRIKIELSPVIRGVVFPERKMSVTESVENLFGFAEIPVVSIPDLYAGKICAALDRQHPRDLFDVKFLMENEGLSDDLRKTFLVYIISHQRPMAELLAPQLKNIRDTYASEFARMARIDVPVDELEAIREKLIKDLNEGITEQERRFLLSFKAKAPDWSLLGIAQIEEVKQLPSVRWKMFNLERMLSKKHKEALAKLEKVLFKVPTKF